MIELAPPSSGVEQVSILEKTKFSFSAEQLTELIASRSLLTFTAFGGLAGLERGLRTDRRSGLSTDETGLDDLELSNADVAPASKVEPDPLLSKVTNAIFGSSTAGHGQSKSFVDRRRAFLDNHLPTSKELTFFQFVWLTYNDPVLFLLSAAAAISLGVGLYQTFATIHTPSNPPVNWIEGVAILVAIVIIVSVGAVNDYQKQRQFRKLNKKKQDRFVKVIRSARSREIPIFDLVVGDVVHIEPGDVIPADGILIDGYRIRCDESPITGESDLLAKCPGDEAFHIVKEKQDWSYMDPFLISGAYVAEGIGTFLVVATGTNSTYGKILSSFQEEPKFTPLQTKLAILAKYIARWGGVTAALFFIILFIRFLAQLPHSTDTPAQKGQLFLGDFIIALTVLVIAVPEGLPLALTLSLAFATTRMLKDNNLVRQLKACETMGNVTTICSDKTGTLTQNEMTVVCGVLGSNILFSDEYPASQDTSGADATSEVERIPIAECFRRLSSDVKPVFKQSIVINSTAFEDDRNSQPSFVGSSTESALLKFARDHMAMGPLGVERSNIKITQMIPFDSFRQCMATIVQLDSTKFRVYVKGASEVLLSKCKGIVENPTEGLVPTPMTTETSQHLRQIITDYSNQSLRTIGIVYRDFENWFPAETDESDRIEVVLEDVLEDLVFLGIIGIRDPPRDGAQEAVRACQNAGIVVRMVTGDNIATALAIAKKCGILESTDDVAIEGQDFRELNEAQKDAIIPRLRVLARSSPEDKRTLVARLRIAGETVAVTGDGSNDALALAVADVGFSMGISGTEVAREASAIVLMDDNFASIVKAIMWGRTVNDAVKKFLPFQITISVTSVGLAFVSAVVSSDQKSVLTPVQLMWINLFQDTLAALALATDPPLQRILDRQPDPKSSPLITVSMWKMICGQSIYQLIVNLVLYFKGADIMSYHTAQEMKQLQAAIFNTYVWMQIFNMYNSRQFDNNFNIFEGIHRNWMFITISLIMIGGQVLIIFVGADAFSVSRLTGAQWGYSVVLGMLSIPVGCAIRAIPDRLFTGLSAGWDRFVSSIYALFRFTPRGVEDRP